MIVKEELVSIIIPIYNSEQYIKETIESCLTQSYNNIELILVNDGSTDKTENIILGFRDERIKYFKLENGGPCRARNHGISEATGELYQFLDHDDVIDKDKISEQVKLYKQYGDHYVYSSKMGTISVENRIVDEWDGLYQKDFTPVDYFKTVFNQFGKYITTGAWLVPRALVESTNGWDARAGINDDGEYFMRVILKSSGIIYSSNSIFYFRRDVTTSLSKQFNSKDVYIKWLYSYKSYAKHFVEELEQPIANELAWKSLSVYYCNSYPHYSDLLQDCLDCIKHYGYKTPNAHGGDLFIRVSSYIGVMNALKLLNMKNKIRSIFKRMIPDG